MNTLTLTEYHKYMLGEEPYPGPSVTEVIKEAKFSGWYPGDEYYLLRGQYIHEAIHLYFKGTLDYNALAEGIKPYVDSAIEYITVTGYKPEHVELSLYHPLFTYCGTLDVWPLRDWKSGGKDDWHAIQIAAYWELARINGLKDSLSNIPASVHLQGNGKIAKAQPYTMIEIIEAKKIFLCALSCWHWRRQKGLI